jgi:hypothetical protein
MHYGLDEPLKAKKGPAMPSLVLIVHAGGSSSDATLIESREGKMNVRAFGGGGSGGNAADLAIVRMLAKRAGLPSFPDASGAFAAGDGEGSEPLALALRLQLATALAPALACCEEMRRRLSAAPQAKTSFDLQTWQAFAQFVVAAHGGAADEAPAPPSALRNDRFSLGRAQLTSIAALAMEAPSAIAAEVLLRGCALILCVCVCVCFCVLCRRLSCLPLSQPPSLTLPPLSPAPPPHSRRRTDHRCC